METKKYTVRYERDEDGYWVASVREVPGCHTQGRSIAAARERIREALGLFVDHADKAELISDIVIPPQLKAWIEEAKKLQALAAELQISAADQMRMVAAALTSTEHFSVRDAAELLEVSHQRVQQLVKD